MQQKFLHSRYRFPSTYSANEETFKEFDATELYCPKCTRAVPVRKRLLLILPEGEKFEYLCALCSTTVGTKVVRGAEEQRNIII